MARLTTRVIESYVNLECSDHMTGDEEKLHELSKYKGGCMLVITNNSRLTIAHVGIIVLTPQYSSHKMSF